MKNRPFKLIRVVVVEPNKRPYVAEIIDSLEDHQRIVGGLIDCIPYDNNADIVTNSEYLNNKLPLNKIVEDDKGAIKYEIHGTIFVTGIPDSEGKNTSLSKELAAKYEKEFDGIKLSAETMRIAQQKKRKKFQKIIDYYKKLGFDAEFVAMGLGPDL